MMPDEPDLLLAYVPDPRASTAFSKWFALSGRAALSRIADMTRIAILRNTKGPEGITLLIRTKIEPLDEGLIERAREILRSFRDEDAERTRIGLFRLAASFSGGSATERVRTILLIGRAAGSNPLEEFRAWYDEDHMFGLSALPGVVRAARYEAVNEVSHSLAVYELADPLIQSGAAWRQVGRNAWTKRIRSRYVKWLDFTTEPLD